VSRGVHPHYRQTLATYLAGGLELEEIPVVAEGEHAGTTDLTALERMLAETDRPVAGIGVLKAQMVRIPKRFVGAERRENRGKERADQLAKGSVAVSFGPIKFRRCPHG
jgi:hypothetical protein